MTILKYSVYVFVGFFNVHDRGDFPFSCGNIKDPSGFQLLEAFNFAVEQVNKKSGSFSGKLNGVKLGGVALDTCSDPKRTTNTISNILNGVTELEDNKKTVQSRKFDAFVGGASTDEIETLTSVLNEYKIPLISYGATSSYLSNREESQYFLRTIPGDKHHVRAILKLLTDNNVEYVQVVNSDSVHGTEAAKEFLKAAKEQLICVAQQVVIKHSDMIEDVEEAVKKLSSKNKRSVVILLLDKSDLHPFLKAVIGNTEALKFTYIGTNVWGSEELSLLEKNAMFKAYTVVLENRDVQRFDEYLLNKFPGHYTRNPWFNEIYEYYFNCKLRPLAGDTATRCPTVDGIIPKLSNYVQDNRVLYTINAVYAAAMGIHKTLERKCGKNYSGACPSYFRARDRRRVIFEEISEATFEDPTSQEFSFAAPREGSLGYNLFGVERRQGRYNYNLVS